jgi:hypothetical protein
MCIVEISLERRIGRKKNIQKETHTEPNSLTGKPWPQQRLSAISVGYRQLPAKVNTLFPIKCKNK